MRTFSHLRTATAAPDPELRWQIAAVWTLFVGIGLLMLGNGLQGSVVGVRASLEGFPTAVTGLIISAYYIGFLAGSSHTPVLLARVGHIRVFAALASLASGAVLLHAVFVNPVAWTIIRLLIGFCLAGLFVVAESWLNDRTNESRGQMLSMYMVVLMGSLGGGQLLLNVANPAGFELFVLASVLVSVAVVPMSLAATPAPRIEALSRIGIRTLFHRAPLGVVGTLGVGFSHGTLLGMGAVYAASAGFSRAEISGFMAVTVLGGVILQIPAGRLSDIVDRRRVISVMSAGAAGLAFLGAVVVGPEALPLIGLMAGIGGLAIPLYSITVAHANDYLEPHQRIGASATLVFVSGIGSIAGPLVTSFVMTGVGLAGFFWTLLVVHGCIGGYAVYRITRRRPAADDQRVDAEPLPPRATPEALHLSGLTPGLDVTGEVPIVHVDSDTRVDEEQAPS